MTSYPTPQFTRPALPPGIVGTIVLVAGVALVGGDGFIWIRYVVSILAAIACVLAVQATKPWWIALYAPIVIAWNPVIPFEFKGVWWLVAQFVGAFAFLAGGVLLKVRNPEDRNRRR